jgi:hypothetical protein
MIKLCIFGTRTFYDNPEASKILDEEILKIKPDMIVTADADGVCKLAIDKAKKYKIPLEIHFLDQEKHGRGKYHYRSLECLKSSNLALFIHDGKSIGTKNEIELANKIGLESKYYKIKPYTPPKAKVKRLSPEEIEDFKLKLQKKVDNIIHIKRI